MPRAAQASVWGPATAQDQIPGHDSHRRQICSFLKHRQERSYKTPGTC